MDAKIFQGKDNQLFQYGCRTNTYNIMYGKCTSEINGAERNHSGTTKKNP
jgi:hypothetical protein